MRYEHECDECGYILEEEKSIKIGPSKNVKCPLCKQVDNKDVEMRHVVACNFILKGDGWPGKDLKKAEYDMGRAREHTDHQLGEDNRNQRVVEEVMNVRRQGKAATENLKRNNPQKFAEYEAAVKKGYRAKAKSYELKT